ncbi:MAG: hypothetical protein K1X89_02605 [Myxococcaceae bacterium]|nr:hypothetical protein [Myxococcaceae bacterium]
MLGTTRRELLRAALVLAAIGGLSTFGSCSSPGSGGASGGGASAGGSGGSSADGGGAACESASGGGAIGHISTVVEVGRTTEVVLDRQCPRDPGPLDAHLHRVGGRDYASVVTPHGGNYYAEFLPDEPGLYEAIPTYGASMFWKRIVTTAALPRADSGIALEVPASVRCVRASILTSGAIVCRFPEHDGLGVFSNRRVVQQLPGVESFTIADPVLWSVGDAGLERWVDADGGALVRTGSTPASVDLRLAILPNGDLLGVEPSAVRRFAFDAGSLTEIASSPWVGGELVPFAVTQNGRWLMQANDAGVCFGPVPLGGADGGPRCPMSDLGPTTADLGRLWPMECGAGTFLALEERSGGEPVFVQGAPGYLEAWVAMEAPPLANRSPFPGPSFARGGGNHTPRTHLNCQGGVLNLGPSLTHVTPVPYQGRIELASYGNLSDDVEVITTSDSVLIRPYDGGTMRLAPR